MEIRNHPGPGGYDRDKLFDKPREDVWLRPLRLRNEFVARYHYLGYKTLVGAQMRYAVHDRNGWPLAMLGFSTAAWKLAPRDNFIGWTPEKREKNLPLVVDNPRFLILPPQPPQAPENTGVFGGFVVSGRRPNSPPSTHGQHGRAS